MPTSPGSKAFRTVPAVFADASRPTVERAARRLRSRLRYKRWLASTNDYLHQAPKEIREEFGKRKTPLVHPKGSHRATHLAEYVAASTILHCADGWSYLGRAMAAQLRGDIGAARHLGYYAELRAAVSLLAGQGIGVFGGIHVVLKESGDVELFRQEGTHRFVWAALSKWTEMPTSLDLFGQVIQPSDAPLAQWLSPLAGSPVWKATGRDYLRTWGLDVERFGLDHEARNDSSYQPRTAFGAKAPSSSRAARFSRDFWGLFEPDGATNFGSLDRYLLRRMLRRLFEAQTENTVVEKPEAFIEFLEPALDAVQTSETRDQLVNFLSGRSYTEDPPLFAEAEKNSPIEDTEDHLQVIARAALLLRVASGAARQLLIQAALAYPDFEWWVRQIAANRALAAEDSEILEQPEQLWGDVESAIEMLDLMMPAGKTDTYTEMGDGGAHELSMLGSCERIALWGLAA